MLIINFEQIICDMQHFTHTAKIKVISQSLSKSVILSFTELTVIFKCFVGGTYNIFKDILLIFTISL